jgi:KDO2-lipid IV(A) lauroyltransferase
MAAMNDRDDATEETGAERVAPEAIRLKHRAEFALVPPAVGMLRALGVDRASALMGGAWRRLAPYDRRHRRADAHLALAMPELSAERRRAILSDMWDNLGRTAAETLLLPELVADRSRFELAASSLDAHPGLRKGGAVFASLHMGNWEVAGWGIHLYGFKVAAVYRPLANPLTEAVLRSRRLPVYDAGLFPREAASAFRLRTLARQGVAIGILADLRDPTGVEVSFFGRPALANALPAVLARRLGLPLVAGRVVRTGGARFRLEAEMLEVSRSRNAETDVVETTQRLTRRFEDWIRENPSQWMWAHRKWKERV